MGKKFKKSAKELERLASLYQEPVATDNIPSITAEMPANPEMAKTTIQMMEQVAIRHDLITLLIVDVAVVATMFLLNYLIDKTALGGVLTNLIARII